MKFMILFFLFVSPLAAQLPDAPKPKTDVDCRGLSGKNRDNCLNRKFPDHWNMNKPVSSLGEAATQKPMLAFEAGLVAATIFDVEGAQHCCRETNPVFGSSRARAYSIGLGTDAALIFTAAYLRKHQHGNAALFFLLWAPTVVHVTFGVDGFRR